MRLYYALLTMYGGGAVAFALLSIAARVFPIGSFLSRLTRMSIDAEEMFMHLALLCGATFVVAYLYLKLVLDRRAK